MTGYSREELIGSSFPDYFTDPERASAGVAKTLAEAFVTNYVLGLRSKAGTETLVSFNASVFKDKQCSGVNIIVTDRSAFRPLLAGLEMAVALRKLYPNDWKVDSYLRLLANADTLERLKRGESAREIMTSWNAGLQEFRKAREAILLY